MNNKKREARLIKNTAIVALGQIGTKFVSFLLLPLYTGVLTTKEYGTVDLLNTYVSLLLPIVFLQLDQAVFRFLIDYRRDVKGKTKLLSTIFLTVIFQVIFFFLLFAIFGRYIHNPYKYFLTFNIVTAMLSGVALQVARGIGDNLSYAMGSLISGIGTVVLNIIFIVILRWGAYGMLLATLSGGIICFFFLFFRLRIYRYIKLRFWDISLLKRILKYSVPLIPNSLSWWIINASDRTIVTHFLGVSANGVYSVSNKFSGIIITFFSIFNMTWTESASVSIQDEDSSEYFSNVINTAFNFFMFVCLFVIAVMPFAFKYLISGDSYASSYNQIPILILATFFNIVVSLLGSIYVALKKTNVIAKTSIYAAVINISVNLILIKFIGLYSASLSTLFAWMIMSIYRFYDIQKYIILKVDLKMMLIFILEIAICLFTYYYNNPFVSVLVLVIVVIIGLYSNYLFLKQLWGKIIKKYLKN